MVLCLFIKQFCTSEFWQCIPSSVMLSYKSINENFPGDYGKMQQLHFNFPTCLKNTRHQSLPPCLFCSLYPNTRKEMTHSNPNVGSRERRKSKKTLRHKVSPITRFKILSPFGDNIKLSRNWFSVIFNLQLLNNKNIVLKAITQNIPLQKYGSSKSEIQYKANKLVIHKTLKDNCASNI